MPRAAVASWPGRCGRPPEHPLTIPLDLIRSVWSDRHGDQDYVHLFLDADLRWDGTAWSCCVP